MGGMRRGANDQRPNTLAATRKAGYMLRSLVIILECVQEAGRNSMVRQQIEAFRDQCKCKFHLTEVVLALDSVWVSKRGWWAVLASSLSLAAFAIRASGPLDWTKGLGLVGPCPTGIER